MAETFHCSTFSLNRNTMLGLSEYTCSGPAYICQIILDYAKPYKHTHSHKPSLHSKPSEIRYVCIIIFSFFPPQKKQWLFSNCSFLVICGTVGFVLYALCVQAAQSSTIPKLALYCHSSGRNDIWESPGFQVFRTIWAEWER